MFSRARRLSKTAFLALVLLRESPKLTTLQSNRDESYRSHWLSRTGKNRAMKYDDFSTFNVDAGDASSCEVFGRPEQTNHAEREGACARRYVS